jgi:hypothetical protein
MLLRGKQNQIGIRPRWNRPSFIGSTAERVVRYAHCPVLVISARINQWELGIERPSEKK